MIHCVKYVTINSMGIARIFQRGGHTDSYRGYSSDCHLNIVSCLLTRRLTKGGSRAPQDPPGYAYDQQHVPQHYYVLDILVLSVKLSSCPL